MKAATNRFTLRVKKPRRLYAAKNFSTPPEGLNLLAAFFGEISEFVKLCSLISFRP